MRLRRAQETLKPDWQQRLICICDGNDKAYLCPIHGDERDTSMDRTLKPALQDLIEERDERVKQQIIFAYLAGLFTPGVLMLLVWIVA